MKETVDPLDLREGDYWKETATHLTISYVVIVLRYFFKYITQDFQKIHYFFKYITQNFQKISQFYP